MSALLGLSIIRPTHMTSRLPIVLTARTRSAWPASRIRRVRFYLGHGMSFADIAAAMGVTRDMIAGVVKRRIRGPRTPLAATTQSSPHP